jgi:hypothetical protein
MVGYYTFKNKYNLETILKIFIEIKTIILKFQLGCKNYK